MGCAEMLVVGLLDLIADDLTVSVPAAGALVTANALGVCFLIFAAVQSVLTYLLPFLTRVTGVSATGVSVFLLVYSVATTVGSMAGGRFADANASRSIADRWNNDDARGGDRAEAESEGSTGFTFTLEPVAEGTRLTVVETGFDDTSDPSANMESHRQGWDGELDKLVALLGDVSQ